MKRIGIAFFYFWSLHFHCQGQEIGKFNYSFSYSYGTSVGKKVLEATDPAFVQYVGERQKLENTPKYGAFNFRLAYPGSNLISIQGGISGSVIAIPSDTMTISSTNPQPDTRIRRSYFNQYYFLDLPLMLKLNFTKGRARFYGILGPEMNIFISSQIKNTYTRLDGTWEEEIRSNNVADKKNILLSGVVGIGLEWYPLVGKPIGVFLQPALKRNLSSIWKEDINERFNLVYGSLGIMYNPGNTKK